jgi:molybdopterin-containing oxidoreductase family membrane subunit
MTLLATFNGVEAPADEAAPLLPKAIDDKAITDIVCDPLLRWRAGPAWWAAFGICTIGALVTAGAVFELFTVGIGVWGINTSVVWGYAIANYVWWIGIGNAGTLISSLLLLTRQPWRASINRFAEAMTLFAVAIAGLFPIFHLGRPLYFYWLAPYPNTMDLWPQWRSALVWDFWAITSYLLFSIIFWYVGVLPDVATLRDRARGRWRKIYGVIALGWRGSARHWRHYHRLQIALAALATPLVCSVHSIVGLDFAASLMPGWREPIFPPYFVVGAMFSGFAMVVVLAIVIRRGLRLEALITPRHFDAMAKIMLMASIVMGLSYASEWFSAWLGGNPDDRATVAFEFTGSYWPMYIGMLLFNVVAPQLFWAPRFRTNLLVLLIISVLINVGMWFERILIIWNTLSHSFLLSMDRIFYPTIWDWIFLFGPLFLFAWLFLIFVRLSPAISMHEVRELRHAEATAP